jgi:hypothetical protein
MNNEYVIIVGSMMVMVEVSLHWGLGGLGKQRHGSGVNTYTGAFRVRHSEGVGFFL